MDGWFQDAVVAVVIEKRSSQASDEGQTLVAYKDTPESWCFDCEAQSRAAQQLRIGASGNGGARCRGLARAHRAEGVVIGRRESPWF